MTNHDIRLTSHTMYYPALKKYIDFCIHAYKCTIMHGHEIYVGLLHSLLHSYSTPLGALVQKVQNGLIKVTTYDVPGNPKYGQKHPAITVEAE